MCSPESVLEGGRRAQYLRLKGLPGPRDRWREGGGCTAARGLSVSERECRELGVDANMASQWFGGVELPLAEVPPVVTLQDYPSASEGRQRAAAELDRLAGLGAPRPHDR